MTIDVYAADDDLGASGTPEYLVQDYFIRLISDADPDLLLRVSAQLNFLNEAPKRLIFEKFADDTAQIYVVIRCSERSADLVTRKLKQLTSVREVSASGGGAERHTPPLVT
jgi:hypothetical protein